MSETTKTREEVLQVINRIHNNISPSNKNIAWKCVQDAQILKDRDLEFRARYTHYKQLSYGGYGNECAQFFPWFIQFLDQDVSSSQLFQILWIHKWVLEDIIVFSEISRTQIVQIFQEMKSKYLDYQASSFGVISNYESRLHHYLGEPQKAYAAFQNYKNAGQAYCSLDDCEACMVNGVLDVLSYNRKYQELLDFAALIASGKLYCDNVPGATYTHLIQACLFLEKNELAEKYALDAADTISHDEINYESFQFVLIQLALSRRFLKGREIIEKQLAHFYEGMATYYQIVFFQACMIYFHALICSGEKDIQLNLSNYQDGSLPKEKDAVYEVAFLHDFFKNKMHTAISAFDHRNGNTFFADFLEYNNHFLKQKNQLSHE